MDKGRHFLGLRPAPHILPTSDMRLQESIDSILPSQNIPALIGLLGLCNTIAAASGRDGGGWKSPPAEEVVAVKPYISVLLMAGQSFLESKWVV